MENYNNCGCSNTDQAKLEQKESFFKNVDNSFDKELCIYEELICMINSELNKFKTEQESEKEPITGKISGPVSTEYYYSFSRKMDKLMLLNNNLRKIYTKINQIL